MKKKLHYLLLFISANLSAQFTTPNTGVTWRLDDLATNAPGTVSGSGNTYTLSQNLTIAANDTFIIDADATLLMENDVQLIIQGNFSADANNILITRATETARYREIIFESSAEGFMRNVTVLYGKGIRVATGNFEMQSCTLSYHLNGTTTSSALQLAIGQPIINNSTFKFNHYPAIGSAANAQASPIITNNLLEGNNDSNGNRPQINLGPSSLDTLKIIGNTIIGNRAKHMTGGISVSNFSPSLQHISLIKNNTIRDNRYGINVLGYNMNVIIDQNIIEDNTTNPDPMTSGSGIALQGAGTSYSTKISNNQIRRNLWGITAFGNATFTNLGDGVEVIGGNIFADNGNGGEIYAFYNNTANPVTALNNCWIENTPLTPTNVEDVIFHQADNATLGLVNFTPFGCNDLSSPDFSSTIPKIYPNPATNFVNIDLREEATAEIFSTNGMLVAKHQLYPGTNHLPTTLPAGIYLIKFTSGNNAFTQKLVIK
ncbi:T9SS type A sorting domain-containing protein [Flavobacterium sp. NST-5]|uniref:T9SS type A sorting domain-containing protein n=1 Tax=Flavobacterium ichthyis TaxID=2698827 RepID=A0ABW9ZBM9_9FLAO|nr:T9SS type A sorting domain-containing protein [Flavobacterium ichthyis]NBL64500.1 T9SS type A sorting domain-containing protein [Flavobacterium ichthyis]